ncbi:MAG: hypothetical protein ACW96S_10530 [Promethearchaeota archaeon]|jgi:hypothetical protein
MKIKAKNDEIEIPEGLLKLSNLKSFYDWYLNKFNLINKNYVANRFMKDVLKINPKILKMKGKNKELKDFIKYIRDEFGSIIRSEVKKKHIKKIEYSSAYERC